MAVGAPGRADKVIGFDVEKEVPAAAEAQLAEKLACLVVDVLYLAVEPSELAVQLAELVLAVDEPAVELTGLAG